MGISTCTVRGNKWDIVENIPFLRWDCSLSGSETAIYIETWVQRLTEGLYIPDGISVEIIGSKVCVVVSNVHR